MKVVEPHQWLGRVAGARRSARVVRPLIFNLRQSARWRTNTENTKQENGCRKGNADDEMGFRPYDPLDPIHCMHGVFMHAMMITIHYSKNI
ncbi:MAG: hypothetical protein ACRETL_07795 [Gammaproteobacteria bacterium]